jgi:AMMECR1 domain-containing protein
MGTLEPTHENLAWEIIENALSAAFRDPRFGPISLGELAELTISVDVVWPAEPISGTDQLNPARYGVIVQHSGRRGLLLPGIPEITRVDEQVMIARRKGGIGEDDPVELYRFEVERYH